MLTEVSLRQAEVSENFGLCGRLLRRAPSFPTRRSSDLPKLSWLWTVIGPAVGLEVAVKLKAEVVKTSLLAAAGLTVIVGWGGWMLVKVPPLTLVCVVRSEARREGMALWALLGMLPEVRGLTPEASEH